MFGLKKVHGAQVLNPADGWVAAPVIRPVWTPPLGVILLGQLAKLLGRGLWFCARHPVATCTVLGSVWLIRAYGLLVYLGGLSAVAAVLGLWWRRLPVSFWRWTGWPAVSRWRRTFTYGRHWHAAMHLTGLSASFRDREYVPEVKRVRCGAFTDRVLVHMVSGQSPEMWQDQAAALAHTFGAITCQVRVAKPRRLWLVFERADALADTVAAQPVPEQADLHRLPLGLRADHEPWLLRLLGAHVLIAGASGAGKSSVLWSLIRALAGLVAAGLVDLWVLDPKGGMELTNGAPMFARFEADDFEAMAELLEQAVEVMQDRQRRLRGHTRQHVPTVDEPVIVVLVDEMASLTAYLQDRDLRRRIAAAVSLILSQGRAVGVNVVGALQDPRKDILPFRDLFTVRVGLRLTEASQVDMVLGDGARDRGALCDEIPVTSQGTGYVVIDRQREPMRVRAAYVTDAHIDAMAAAYPSPDRRPRPVDPMHGEAA